MESELMQVIWTPAEKPVVLDKFCHLSLDAQKVMVAMYRDFHQRKVEIIKDISMQNTGRRLHFQKALKFSPFILGSSAIKLYSLL